VKINFDFWLINFKSRPQNIKKRQLINKLLDELIFWTKILQKTRYERIIFSVGYPGLYLYSFLMPVKVLYIVHTTVKEKADIFGKFLLKIIAYPHKRLLTVSKSALDSLSNNWLSGTSSRNIGFVYNFYEPKYKVEKKVNHGKSITILTIGSLELYKNPYFFIDIAKLLLLRNTQINFRFLWAGNGSQLSACINLVKDYPQIHFLGYVENVEVLYSEADLYFQPSLEETHGISVLGALYYGIPSIVSENGGLTESIYDGINGIVIDVDNIEDSYHRIIELLSNLDLIEQMRLNSRRIFYEKFNKSTWETSMINYLK
jgi:glycosyltransferase involved in cell wall biosynthesis